MDKKKNEILEEQRRAREEFLKLKRMQNGQEIEPESEAKVAEMTFSQKADNFWYHYKWYVIGLLALVFSIAFMMVQCMNKEKHDLEIVYFSYTATVDTQTEKIAEYFEKYAEDIDGDGKANIQVINCSLNPDIGDRKYRDSILQKIQARIMSGEKSLLYITDSESVKYFDLMETTVPLFEENTCALGPDFYDAVKIEGVPPLPDGLTLRIRNISGTLLEMKSATEKNYNESIRILNAIKEEE